MRSDRRHDLESNDLADSAAALLDRIRPHLGTIGLVATALLLAFAAWMFVESSRSAASEESWNACLTALANPQGGGLEAVVTRYPGTPAAQWAGLALADEQLEQGSQMLYFNRAEAKKPLDEAASRYRALTAPTSVDLVRERATFGLAKAQENLAGIEEKPTERLERLDDARRNYEKVVEAHPGGAVRRFAEARIAALGRESTRQWYDWFAQQTPAPPQPAGAASESAPPAAGATEPATGPAEPAAAEPAAEPAPAGTGTDAPG